MQQYDFATLVSNGNATPWVSFTPVMVRSVGDGGVVRFSFSQCQRAQSGIAIGLSGIGVVSRAPCLHTSPSWYPASPGAVPTWNYAVVNASGVAVAHTTASDTLQMVNQLSELYGTPAYMPADCAHMLKGITAYSMQVTSLEGKFKLGQNLPLAGRINMRQQLAVAERPASRRFGSVDGRV
jgi:transcriptional regulator